MIPRLVALLALDSARAERIPASGGALSGALDQASATGLPQTVLSERSRGPTPMIPRLVALLALDSARAERIPASGGALSGALDQASATGLPQTVLSERSRGPTPMIPRLVARRALDSARAERIPASGGALGARIASTGAPNVSAESATPTRTRSASPDSAGLTDPGRRAPALADPPRWPPGARRLPEAATSPRNPQTPPRNPQPPPSSTSPPCSSPPSPS